MMPRTVSSPMGSDEGGAPPKRAPAVESCITHEPRKTNGARHAGPRARCVSKRRAMKRSLPSSPLAHKWGEGGERGDPLARRKS